MADYMDIETGTKPSGWITAANIATLFGTAAIVAVGAYNSFTDNAESTNPDAGLQDRAPIHQTQEAPVKSTPDNIIMHFPMGTF